MKLKKIVLKNKQLLINGEKQICKCKNNKFILKNTKSVICSNCDILYQFNIDFNIEIKL